jgi:hypothetical protein
MSIDRVGEPLYIVSGDTWVTFDGRDVLPATAREMVLEPGIDPTVMSAPEGDACVSPLSELPPLI